MSKNNIYGFTAFIIHNVDVEEWCSKYDLKVFSASCHACGNELDVNIPFAALDRRGLTAASCQCGNTEVPFSFVDLSFDGLNLNSLVKIDWK